MVLNKKCVFFVITIILVLNTNQSNATEETIQKMVKEFESQLSNEKYKIRHRGALDTIEQVNNEAYSAKKKLNNENEKNAINEVQTGYLNSIKCLAVAGDRAYKANQEAEGISDAETAKHKILEGRNVAKQGVMIAGIAAYLKLGAATVIAGNYTAQQLKESIKFVTFAEQAAYSGLEEIKKLSILGIYCGEPARKLGFKASNEAVEATGSVYYNNLLKSAKIAFGGIDRTKPPGIEDKFARNEAAQKSPEASAAIQSVNNTAHMAVIKMTMSEGSTVQAVYVVRDGIIAAIKGAAAAIQQLQDALKAALNTSGKLLEQPVIQASKHAEKEIAYASANGLQSIGIAGQKVGGKKRYELVKSMSAVQTGRAAAYEAIEIVKSLAVKGLNNEEAAKQTGLTAAIDASLTAAFADYAQLVNAANIAFEVLKSEGGPQIG